MNLNYDYKIGTVNTSNLFWSPKKILNIPESANHPEDCSV